MWAQAPGTSHRKLHTYKREPEELLSPSVMFLQRRPSKQHRHSCPRTVDVRVPMECRSGRCSGAGLATPASSWKSFYYLFFTGEETEFKEMEQHAHRWLVGNSARPAPIQSICVDPGCASLPSPSLGVHVGSLTLAMGGGLHHGSQMLPIRVSVICESWLFTTNNSTILLTWYLHQINISLFKKHEGKQ